MPLSILKSFMLVVGLSACAYAASAADRIHMVENLSCEVGLGNRTSLLQRTAAGTRKVSMSKLRSVLQRKIASLKSQLNRTSRAQGALRRRLQGQISSNQKQLNAVKACGVGKLSSYVIDDFLGTYTGDYSGWIKLLIYDKNVSGQFTLTLSQSGVGLVRGTFKATSGDLALILGSSGYEFSFPASVVGINESKTFSSGSGKIFSVLILSSGEIEIEFPDRSLGGLISIDSTLKLKRSTLPSRIEGSLVARDSSNGDQVADIEVSAAK